MQSEQPGPGPLAKVPTADQYGRGMDVLVVVDGADVPGPIAARARRRIDVEHGPVAPATIADLRAHIPRSVGVIGAPTDRGG